MEMGRMPYYWEVTNHESRCVCAIYNAVMCFITMAAIRLHSRTKLHCSWHFACGNLKKLPTSCQLEPSLKLQVMKTIEDTKMRDLVWVQVIFTQHSPTGILWCSPHVCINIAVFSSLLDMLDPSLFFRLRWPQVSWAFTKPCRLRFCVPFWF